MDIVIAFLNGTIQETIYVQQPPGFTTTHSPHHVCRLRKSLYGFKHNPEAWYEEIDSFLKSIGCICSNWDPNLYFNFNKNDTAIILMSVDDLLITDTCLSDLISSLKLKL